MERSNNAVSAPRPTTPKPFYKKLPAVETGPVRNEGTGRRCYVAGKVDFSKSTSERKCDADRSSSTRSSDPSGRGIEQRLLKKVCKSWADEPV